MYGSESINPEIIANLSRSQLEKIPAGTPPSGLQPRFDDPPTLVPAILGTGTAFLGPALLLYFVRVYSKIVITKRVFWDDFCCTLGLIFALAYYVSVIFGCTYGGIGRHMWDLHLYALVNTKSLAEEYVTTVTSVPALGLIKLTLFIQYYSIFWPFKWVRISAWVGGVLSALFYMAVTITAFALNSPRPGESLLDAVLSKRYSIFANFSVPIGAIGVVLDLYLIILPVRVVMSLQMRRARKIGLSIMFLTGAFASVSSIIGLYYRVKTQQETNDETWIVSYLHIFIQIEMFAGISCACMPSVPLFLRVHKLETGSLVSLLRYGLWTRFAARQGSDTNTTLPKETTTSEELPKRDSRPHESDGFASNVVD